MLFLIFPQLYNVNRNVYILSIVKYSNNAEILTWVNIGK